MPYTKIMLLILPKCFNIVPKLRNFAQTGRTAHFRQNDDACFVFSFFFPRQLFLSFRRFHFQGRLLITYYRMACTNTTSYRTSNAKSPGLVVMGDNLQSKGRGFESRRHTLDGHFDILTFFTLICCKNCLLEKTAKKRPWMAHF